MVAAGMTGLVLGYALGLRYRVMVLVLVELVALAACLVTVITGLATTGAGLTGFALFSAFVQASYVAAVAYPLSARRPAGARLEA